MSFIKDELQDLCQEMCDTVNLIGQIHVRADEFGDAWLVQEIAVLRQALNGFYEQVNKDLLKGKR